MLSIDITFMEIFMADNKPLHNNPTTMNSSGGGSCRVTIPAGTTLQGGQPDANGAAQAGVSQPCRSCVLVPAKDVATLRVRIGSACTSTTGTPLITNQYLPMKVDDLNLLYFFGTNADVCDIIFYN